MANGQGCQPGQTVTSNFNGAFQADQPGAWKVKVRGFVWVLNNGQWEFLVGPETVRNVTVGNPPMPPMP